MKILDTIPQHGAFINFTIYPQDQSDTDVDAISRLDIGATTYILRLSENVLFGQKNDAASDIWQLNIKNYAFTFDMITHGIFCLLDVLAEQGITIDGALNDDFIRLIESQKITTELCMKHMIKIQGKIQ